MLQPLPVLSLILEWKGSWNRVGTKCYTRRKIYKRIKTIYKTESEWLHFPAPFQESNRLIIISLKANNIDNYEKRNALSVVEEVEALDEEYYAAFPPFEELAKQYSDFEGKRIYRIRDLYYHYRRLFLADHKLDLYDVTDERQSGSRRY